MPSSTTSWLLFIYLELGAMMGIYFKTERLPVLFLLYIAIHRDDPLPRGRHEGLLGREPARRHGGDRRLTLAVLVLQIAGSKFGTSRGQATKVL